MWVRACILFPCIDSNKWLTHYRPTLTQQILSEPSLYALFLGAWTAEIRKAKKKNPKNAQLEAFRATCMSVWPALCVPVDIGGGTRAPHHGMSALGATTAFFEESTLDGDGSGAAMTPRGHHSVGREVAMQPFNVREMAMDQPFMAHTAQTLMRTAEATQTGKFGLVGNHKHSHLNRNATAMVNRRTGKGKGKSTGAKGHSSSGGNSRSSAGGRVNRRETDDDDRDDDDGRELKS